MKLIWDQLRERKLVQWAIAYLAGAWLLLQVLDLLAEPFDWPTGILRALTVLLAVGFVAVLVLAWYHGEKGAQRVSGPELVMMATLFLLAGVGIFLARGQARESVATTARSEDVPDSLPGAREYTASVAVLPFANIGGSERDEYFSEGITEEIISQLAGVEGLKVISRTSVVALKDSRLTLPQIADTLAVRHVLEGSVRRAGDRVKVTVQLIDPRTDTHLWAETYDRQLTDIFTVQEEIARQVSARLVSTMQAPRPRSLASRTERTAAYDAYLEGTFWRQRRTRDALQRAIQSFERAIALDSTYAPAYAALGSAYVLWVTYGYRGDLDSYSAIARALNFAQRAVALDPELSEAYAARGFAYAIGLVAIDSALTDLQRAIQLQPSSNEAHIWYANPLFESGQIAEALAESETAIRLDPLAPGPRTGYGIFALGAREYELALRESQRAQLLEPRLSRPLRQQALALLLLGRPDECVRLDLADWPEIKAMCMHSLGRTAEAEALIHSALATAATSYRAAGIAAYYAWTGQVQPAVEWLERGARATPVARERRMIESGVYDRIRSDARFRAGLQRADDYVRKRMREELARL